MRRWWMLGWLLLLCLAGCSGLSALVEPMPTAAVLMPSPIPPTPVWSATPLPTVIPTPTASVTPTLMPVGTLPAGYEATPRPNVIGVLPFPADVNPLTGLRVSNPEVLEHRPLLIKISNYPRRGRPHAGLGQADFVFDYYIGEGLDRFLAVFYSQQPTNIGPLRSGRLVDAQLTDFYGGVLVYRGADPEVDDDIVATLPARSIADAPCPAICDGYDAYKTSTFVSVPGLRDWMAAKGWDDSQQELNGMVFSEAAPQSSLTADMLGVQFSNINRTEWYYDPTTGKYARYYESDVTEDEFVMVQSIDRNTGNQVEFDNLIILFAEYIEYKETLHNVYMNTNFAGQPALFFRDGQVVEGTWRITGKQDPLIFTDANGITYPLKPGVTWVYILGLASTVEQVEPGHWEADFDLP